jgi:hypothetical protein
VRALEAEAVLLERLEALGVACEHRSQFQVGAACDVRTALDVFMAFVTEPIDEPDDVDGTSLSVDADADGDLLLFETGIARILPPAEKPYWGASDGPVPEAYQLSFTRQFSFADTDGDYCGQSIVALKIQTEPTSALIDLADEQIWGVAGPASTRDELVAVGRDPNTPYGLGGAAWQAEVTASRAFSTALAADPTMFYMVQHGV